jgi:hypothetical protein
MGPCFYKEFHGEPCEGCMGGAHDNEEKEEDLHAKGCTEHTVSICRSESIIERVMNKIDIKGNVCIQERIALARTQL